MKATLLIILAIGLIPVENIEAKMKHYLTLSPPTSVDLVPGKSQQVSVKLDIEKGIHIQANPATLPNLIPTVLKLKEDQQVTGGKPIYPESHPFSLQGSDEKIATYEGKTQITIPVTLKSGTKPGKYKVAGSLRYQACDAKSCFFPRSLDFEFSVNAAKAANGS